MGHGVDSEPSGWVTDYALMASMFVFAASLRKRGATPWAWEHGVRGGVKRRTGLRRARAGASHIVPLVADERALGVRAHEVAVRVLNAEKTPAGDWVDGVDVDAGPATASCYVATAPTVPK